MDVPAAVLSAIKYVEETKKPDIIFIEGQSSLTEKGNPHPRGLSAAILIGAAPDAVIIGPSNPITSISPILSLDGVKEALENTHVIAVSPIIGTDSVSGPASKFMDALGIEVSSLGVASLYESFLDTIVIDKKDNNLKDDLEKIVSEVIVTNTIMKKSPG